MVNLDGIIGSLALATRYLPFIGGWAMPDSWYRAVRRVFFYRKLEQEFAQLLLALTSSLLFGLGAQFDNH